MPRVSFRRFLAGIVLAVPAVLTSCGDAELSGPSEDVVVGLTSHEGAITILAPGETYPCPSCDLVNLGFRAVHIQMRQGETFTFRAYFGGNLRDQRTCVWRGEHVITVDWLNAQLNCINWSPA